MNVINVYFQGQFQIPNSAVLKTYEGCVFVEYYEGDSLVTELYWLSHLCYKPNLLQIKQRKIHMMQWRS